MTAQLELFNELSFYEDVDVEYKSAKGGLPGSLWETYSAFANTQGGAIFLGVVEKDNKLIFQGVDDPERMVKNIWDTVNNRNKVNRNLLQEHNVSIIPGPSEGVRLIRIDVPRANRWERPIYINNDPSGGSYRRNKEGDYRCDEREVRRMFSDQSEDPADQKILEHYSLDDLDPESIRQFRQLFLSRAPEHPWHGEDDRGLMHKLGGWRRDRATGIEGLTLAGLLMFGKTDAIAERIPDFHLDYRERLSGDPSIRWTDRLTSDGRWEANLFQFYQRVKLKIALLPGLKAPFQVDENGYRKSISSVHEALQEALVNALIHADYHGQGGIVIDCFPDRFEFSNPGTLLLSREQLQMGGISQCRNPNLQKMFQMLGIGDKAGSGLDRIRRSWNERHWQTPSLEETARPDRVRLTLSMISMLPEDIMQALQGYFGPRMATLDKDAVYVLAMTAMRGEISNSYLQGFLTLHRVDITKLLQQMVQQEFLIADGEGRGRVYHLPETYYYPASGTNIPANGESIPHISLSTPHNADNTPHNEAELLRIAQAGSQKKRRRPEDTQSMILELCADEFLTPAKLGELLGRNSNNIRDRFLSPMLEQGLLVLRFPHAPKHPLQAYKTANPKAKDNPETQA